LGLENNGFAHLAYALVEGAFSQQLIPVEVYQDLLAVPSPKKYRAMLQ
jgi:hypothetical protein